MATSDRVKLRALVVGSGWGQHAAEALAAHPATRLVAIVGRGSERTASLGNRLCVPVFSDLQAAIEASASEIAAVAAGERSNAELVRSLLEAGCHVLCSHPVAREARTVGDLAALAQRKSRLAATDYTMRLTEAFTATEDALGELGPALRVSVQCPGAALAIGIDIAIGLAGKVRRVYASASYPPGLSERVFATPRAFPPSVLIEHASGCVSSIVPVPHADPRAAHRVTVSTERGRIDLALPSDGATLVRYYGHGRVERSELAEPLPAASPEETFAEPMRALVRRFVDCVTNGLAVHSPLMEEAHRRAAWAAMSQSVRRAVAVDVDA